MIYFKPQSNISTWQYFICIKGQKLTELVQLKLMYSFNKYILSTYYVLLIVLDAEDTDINKTD